MFDFGGLKDILRKPFQTFSILTLSVDIYPVFQFFNCVGACFSKICSLWIAPPYHLVYVLIRPAFIRRISVTVKEFRPFAFIYSTDSTKHSSSFTSENSTPLSTVIDLKIFENSAPYLRFIRLRAFTTLCTVLSGVLFIYGFSAPTKQEGFSSTVSCLNKRCPFPNAQILCLCLFRQDVFLCLLHTGRGCMDSGISNQNANL